MKTCLLENAAVYLPGGTLENAYILINNGRIARISKEKVSSDETIDLNGVTLYAGFIDVHIHGAVGIDVNTAGADGLLKIAAYLAQNGVAAWMPTLVPDSDENYLRAIAVIDEVMSVQTEMPIAQVVGVHYEGVFANEKMCGALRPEYFKKGGRWAVERGQLPLLKSGVHMTTLAPEVDGGIELIERLVAEGWIVAIGHTQADAATLDRAFAAGARHLTHFFNAMTGLHHREPGVAAWGLANEGVTFDIIADGVHVHPEMLRLACRVKTADMVSLISDSVAPTGLGDGEYELWGETVTVRGGRTQNGRGSIAGSVVTMLDCVATMRALGFSDNELENMASLNPAKLLNIDETHGSIEAGKRADLVGIDVNGKVAFTMIGGKMIPPVSNR